VTGDGGVIDGFAPYHASQAADAAGAGKQFAPSRAERARRTMMIDRNVDILVIGAGQAGLAAGYYL
jgi:heterodisulfide reductase subunit A-like polyferredoxin